MAVLDTLEILIEADRRGLESQLKAAGRSISDFVSKMNAEQVNWRTIMTRTISPALISGIASSFAIAISSAMSFQQSLLKSGQMSSTGFGAASGEISDSVIQMSNNTGIAAEEVAQAFGLVNQTFKETSVAQGILNDLTMIAQMRNMDLLEVTRLLVPLLEAWGIETVPEATDALAKLNQSTQLGKISFSDLSQALTENGAILSTKTNISLGDAAIQLQAVSRESKLTAEETVAAFKEITMGVADPLREINILTEGVGSIRRNIDEEGIIGAFDSIATSLQKFGPIIAVEIGGRMGMAESATIKLRETSTDTFIAMTETAKIFSDQVKDIATQNAAAKTETDRLREAWATFRNTLNQSIGRPFIDFLTEALQGANELFKSFNSPMPEGWFKEWKNAISEMTLGPAKAGFNAIGEGLNAILPDQLGPQVKANVPQSQAPKNMPSLGEGQLSKHGSTVVNNNFSIGNVNMGQGGSPGTEEFTDRVYSLAQGVSP